MKLSKQDFTGTGKVFRFTLLEHLKNKSNIVSIVILVIFALVSVPVVNIFSGSSGPDMGIVRESKSPIETVLVLTDMEVPPLDEADFAADPYFSDTKFVLSEKDYTSDTASAVGEKDRTVVIEVKNDGQGYLVSPDYENALDPDEAFYAASAVTAAVERAVLRGMGASEVQLAQAAMQIDIEVLTQDEYLGRSDGPGFGTKFGVQYFFSIFVMILSIMAASYIIRAIVEEKASKLVELLMVSVRPLALVLGKILAVMVYVFGTFVVLALAFAVSSLISTLFLHAGSLGDMIGALGVDSANLNISPMTVLIVLVSLILGYLTFSILAGISGTCCSTMEDIEYGQLSVILIVMAGYLVSCVAAAFTSTTASVIVSLLPVVCVFCAPVCYVCGGISFGILVLSWVLQAVTVALLALFCARVYNELLIHRGSRVKMRELFKMAKREKEEA
ncbi:MAG: ABC transporter permease [Oscillospiraceae bacterium]|nr:ABC transporter permease [Oscillospiraceae bacterium]